ncbi:polysaccharide deacetylase family protein [Modestobacter sp. VKM Ac-2984]|uniref:polysaccharide deacetylase family protein n=1 Tax=Modestobacter sp. VKM Ac-2984 TaxID=3004138 RepID=UPI0022AB1978|nr:polysaccharide deacetylase family protein [Modestobacter sp. VKM Ac-2984]MCZ2815106.1 polysaccharide deacetylase family protein [Modestobacter sp. VKM Ac-2984]
MTQRSDGTTANGTSQLSHRLRLAVTGSLSAAALALGVLQAPSAGATNSCPEPIRAVLDTTPATYANTVALTFDDGPSPQWTPEVLDVLRARGVKATFFLIGRNVADHPEMARRIVAEGHLIGNHTYTHPDLTQVPPSVEESQMDRTTQAIGDATGVRPCFFRGPYGTHNGASVQSLAWERDMNVAGWSLDTRDWEAPASPSTAFQDRIVQRATAPRSSHPIVLMHDGPPGNYRYNTAAALDRIISYYADRGYVFTDPAGQTFASSAIQKRYNQLGGPASFLGAPVTDELPTPDGYGAFTHYQNGSIYWSPATGPHFVRGGIRDTWAALGWEKSALAYPTTDERPTPNAYGAFNHFQNGSIYWSPGTGAHEVRGAIHDRWAELGYEQSSLGFPTTNEIPTSAVYGAYNRFQDGSIYWSPGTGAHEVRGAIHDRWAELGYEQSSLGLPVSGEYSANGVQRSDFQNGYITWTPESGAVVHESG